MAATSSGHGGSGRRRAGMALALAALALTAACSSGDAEPAPPAPSVPAGPALLTVAVYGPPPVITAYAKIAADFSAKNPDTVVNIRPYDTHEALTTALDDKLAAGTPPDAFLVDQSDLTWLRESKAISRLDGLLAERGVDFGDGYQRDALEAFSADNGLQCMPVDASPLVVYYNTSLVNLAQLTEPGDSPVNAQTGWNVDQFEAAARQSVRPGVRGLYVAPAVDQIAPFIWSNGGEVVDDQDAPTTLTLADDGSAEALERLLEIVRDPQLTFNQRQLERRSAVARFRSGQLAMILGHRALTPTLRVQEDLSFDVMPMPRMGSRATSGTMTGLCLSKSSEQVKQTADFLAYAVSDEASALLAATGYATPTNVDVVNSDAFTQPDLQPANAAVFSSQVRNIRLLPSVDTWPDVAARTSELLTGLLYDPVIEPLDGRLKAIDAASAPLFTPVPLPSPSPSP